jgi:alkanesulfonate monooxygenase SsuD/methylene tetrahydromethanopterin reductase-like flavin-dependent oxidoreductase (luciferase family)
MTTVVDTLGFDAGARTRWIEKAHDAGIPAHAVLFDTAAAVCEERNATKARPLPKTVMKKQLSRFQKVRGEIEDDGFDEIHTTRSSSATAIDVSPRDPEDEAESDGQVATGHSFGLIVSRLDWPEGDRGEQLVSIARRAERAGFRDIWVMDHFRQIRGVGRPWEDLPEAHTALSFIAGATETIRLGTLVNGITHRPPIVLGKMVATLDALSGGRVNCGLGVAWDDAEHAAFAIPFPDLDTRYALLEETLQMLPKLWGKGTPEFKGELIQSPELICYPRPVQERIPILIGGGGERRTLRLVARYADAGNVFGNPEQVGHKARVLARHCNDLDRDPAEVEVTHLTNVLVATDRKALRARVDLLRGRNTPADTYMSRNGAGTVDDLVELFEAYGAAGAHHSIVALPDVAMEDSIETFADVIAALGTS